MRNVTVRQLQMFVEAADTASFTRAAERLRVSPAAVSFQIKQIEDGTGFALFERIGKKAVPTDAGRALLAHARIVLQTLHDADQALMALSGVLSGRAKIGAVSTAKYIVPHIMARFQRQFPGVTIDLRFGNRRQIATALARGEIELAVMGRPPEESDLTADAFAAHPTLLVAAPDHPLAAAPSLEPADLAGIALIAREEGSGTRLLMEQLCADAGIPPRIAMTADSNETIKQAVMAGMGVSFISRHTIDLELHTGRLAVLDVIGTPVMRQWHVAHLAKKRLSPTAMAFKQFVLTEGRELMRTPKTLR
jgi:LysR family transcriptional regulator, low CO2-responsive transcriptional regulator